MRLLNDRDYVPFKIVNVNAARVFFGLVVNVQCDQYEARAFEYDNTITVLPSGIKLNCFRCSCYCGIFFLSVRIE